MPKTIKYFNTGFLASGATNPEGVWNVAGGSGAGFGIAGGGGVDGWLGLTGAEGAMGMEEGGGAVAIEAEATGGNFVLGGLAGWKTIGVPGKWLGGSGIGRLGWGWIGFGGREGGVDGLAGAGMAEGDFFKSSAIVLMLKLASDEFGAWPLAWPLFCSSIVQNKK